MVKPSQPNSPIGRGYRVGRLGLSLVGSYLGYQLQNLFLGSESREERRHSLHRRVALRAREELESLNMAPWYHTSVRFANEFSDRGCPSSPACNGR